MPRIIVTEFVTLDGVMEAPGGEPSHPHTGWAATMGEEAGAYKFQEVQEADAHLLGRVTYESFAGAWPTYEGPFADRMNAFPKYVVSTTMTSADWTNSHVVPTLDAVRELDGELLVAGSRTLVHSLLRADLVDELRLLTFPLSVGGGDRVFPEGHERFDLRLRASRTFDDGATLLHTYTRA
jgi:dihydrofolate reductase